MKDSIKSLIRKFYYSVSANFLNFFVSLILAFVVPKFMGVDQYGYWQLYIFYVGFVGFFHFGLADGIYLRYGGAYYNNLNKQLMHSQYWLLVIFELFVLITFSIFSLTQIEDTNKSTIIIFTAANCVIFLPKTLLYMILQATGRIQEYARNFIAERFIYLFLIIVFLIFGIDDFRYMLSADIFAKLIALLSINWLCRDIVKNKRISLKSALVEFWENISSGIKLMIANIAGLLIIGIVRFGIETVWDIATFGKVSFALSIANFILTLITALGLVVFPVIKRSNSERLPLYYETFGFLLTELMFIFLVIYYPIKLILSIWLPQYIDSIHYLSIIFPISIFEARSSLLINTYFKVLRKEKSMLLIYLVSVIFSLLATLLIVFYMKNLIFAIFSIVFLVVIKCILPDIYLQKILGMRNFRDLVWSIILTIAFIFCHWHIGSYHGWIIYIALIIIQFISRSTEIKRKIKTVRDLLN